MDYPELRTLMHIVGTAFALVAAACLIWLWKAFGYKAALLAIAACAFACLAALALQP